MSAANGTALRPLTPVEEKAVQMYRSNVAQTFITNQTGLNTDQLTVALERKAKWDQLHAGSAKREAAERNPDLRPLTELADAHGEGLMPVAKPMSVASLLAWAEKSGTSRAKTLAARIREATLELRGLHDGEAARAAAAAEVERLSAELEAAKARMRGLGGKTAAVVKAAASPDRKAYLAAVRTWARANGHELSDYGQIRHDVEAAYLAATGGGS